jgi:hypothetical protein
MSSNCTHDNCMAMNDPIILQYGITETDLTAAYTAYHPMALTGEKYKVTLGMTLDAGVPALFYPNEASLPPVTDIEQVMSVLCSGRGGNVSIGQAIARTAKDAIFERVPLCVLEMCTDYHDGVWRDDYNCAVAR